MEGDVTVPAKVQFLMHTAVEKCGLLYVLVHKVGEFQWRMLAESGHEEWESIFRRKLMRVPYASKSVATAMRRQQ